MIQLNVYVWISKSFSCIKRILNLINVNKFNTYTSLFVQKLIASNRDITSYFHRFPCVGTVLGRSRFTHKLLFITGCKTLLSLFFLWKRQWNLLERSSLAFRAPPGSHHKLAELKSSAIAVWNHVLPPDFHSKNYGYTTQIVFFPKKKPI